MYHGWADPLVTPDASLIMHKQITEAVGPAAEKSLALFMVPGMGHCQGGPGTDVFDKVAALDQWVAVREQAAVDRRLAHDRDGRRSHAAALCVSGGRSLHRQRQHR